MQAESVSQQLARFACEVATGSIPESARPVSDEAVGEMQARVQIELSSGEILTAEYDLDAPLAYAQREAKVRTKSAALIGQDSADALWAVVAAAAGASDADASVSILTEQVFA